MWCGGTAEDWSSLLLVFLKINRINQFSPVFAFSLSVPTELISHAQGSMFYSELQAKTTPFSLKKWFSSLSVLAQHGRREVSA